jgi:uncharacterized protein (TIGR02246 family)
MKRLLGCVCVAGALAFSGCAHMSSETHEDDARLVREGEVAWAQDWGSKDIERIVSHYADDASLLVAGMPLMTGKEAIRGGLRQMISDPNLALSFQSAQVEIAKGGDLAYSRGTYTMTMSDPATKQPVTEKGKYLTIYRKQADGTWKAIQDMNNNDAPPVPAAAVDK